MKQVFKTVLTRSHPIITNHQVKGRPVLPGMAYIDLIFNLACPALDIDYRKYSLQKLNIFHSLAFNSESIEVAIVFENLSEGKAQKEWRVFIQETRKSNEQDKIYASGELKWSDDETPTRLVHENNLTSIGQLEDIYTYAKTLDLIHSGVMRPQGEIFHHPKGALVSLRLDAPGETGFLFHPGLLDGAAMASQVLLKHGAGKMLLLPTFYQHVHFNEPLASDCLALINLEEGDVSHTLNIEFYDIHGTFLGLVNGIAVVAADARDTNRMGKAAAGGDSLDQQIKNALVAIIAEELSTETSSVSINEGFFDIGLESAQLLNILEKINRTLGLELNPVVLFENSNIRDLTLYLQDRQPNIPLKHADTVLPDASKTLAMTALSQDNAFDIAIVGISGRYPGARNIEEFWENLRQGKNCVTEVPTERWDWRDYFSEDRSQEGRHFSKWGGFIHDMDQFDPLFFNISPREAEMIDPQDRLVLEQCWLALEDAGYTRERLHRTCTRNGSHKVGVYMGAMFQEYPLFAAESTLNGKALGLDSGLSSISARVSFFWDLNGPSMTVDTACSSSLTTIYLACKALGDGDIDAALAGGVNLTLHPNKYLMLSDNQFISSRGHCASFGIDGDGYIPGEGVGVVVLKRLKDAEQCGDQIYGVIKGAAINHGGKASGYTVPNPKAQQRLIEEAIKSSGVDPQTISYIEAHGTGTSLGDPIEIRGLSGAFAAAPPQSIAIGSVKSNLGHCEAAAGIAGLTKLLLQMRHEQLVPSLHSEKLNPHIPFESTPFKVNRELSTWSKLDVGGKTVPRRAGISSFGAGGANAHLVIEEYQPVERYLPEQEETQLILLSAKSRDRLQRQAQLLIDSVERLENRGYTLSDIAHTLQRGREALEVRVAFVCKNFNEFSKKLGAIAADSELDSEIFIQGDVKGKDVSSLEAETENVVNELIHTRKWLELARYWAKGHIVDWEKLYQKPGRFVSLPSEPFEREYCWAPVKREPAFSGKKLHPLVHENCSDFSAQKYRSRFNGKEKFLSDHKVNGVPVLPAVAWLEMVCTAAVNALGTDNSGILPRLKHVNWLRPLTIADKEESVIVEFATQGNQEVAFSVKREIPQAGHNELLCSGQVVFVSKEETTRQNIDLQGLMNQCNKTWTGSECYPIFKNLGLDYGESHRCIEEILVGESQALVRLKNLPAHVDIERFNYLVPGVADSALQACMALDFDKQVDIDLALPFALEEFTSFSSQADWAWIQLENPATPGADFKKYNILLLDGDGKVCAEFRGSSTRTFRSEAKVDSQRTSVVLMEPVWKPFAAPTAYSDVQSDTHLVVFLDTDSEWGQRFLPNLQSQLPDTDILQLCHPNGDQATDFEFLSCNLFTHIKSLLEDKNLQHIVVQVVIRRNYRSQLNSAVSALLKSAHYENPGFTGQVVQVDEDLTGMELAGILLEQMRSGLHPEVSYENKAPRYRTFNIKDTLHTNEASIDALPWKESGVYLIVGGVGGIGKLLVKDIACTLQRATIIVTGRSEPSEKILAELEALASQNITIEYCRADIVDENQVQNLIASVAERFGELNGIIHCAGILRDNFIVRKSTEEFLSVIRSKVSGLHYLDSATAHCSKLDFFALFSSLSGAIAKVGQADYSTANAYMDMFASYRNKLCTQGARYGHTISINWPLWQEGGMTMDGTSEQDLLEFMGMVPLSTRNGLNAFYKALQSNADQLIVIEGQKEKITSYISAKTQAQLLTQVTSTRADTTRSQNAVPTEQLRDTTLQYLRKLLARVLKISFDRVRIDDPFEKYGIDSIAVMQLTSAMEKDLGSLSKTLFFEYHSISALADHMLRKYGDRFEHLFAASDPAPLQDTVRVATAKPVAFTGKRFLQGVEHASAAKYSETPLDIAIVGLSGCYPEAPDLETFWQNLANGKDCIIEIPEDRWDWRLFYSDDRSRTGHHYSKWGGFIKGVDQFDPLFFNISPREAVQMDPQERLFLEHSWMALEDAGYTRSQLQALNGDFDSAPVGVYAGVMFSDYQLYGAEQSLRGNPTTVGGSFASIANRVSYFLNIHGPSMTLDTMCSSSLTAIHLACQDLRLQRTHMAIAGGVNVSIHPNKYLGLSSGQFVSSQGHCQSFGEGGDGYVPGEGVGVVILKRLEDARRDGDHIYGVIAGSNLNHGGKTNGYSVPNPNAQRAAVSAAMMQANVHPEDISYIEAHGTGTKLGDPIEIAGLTQAFGENLNHKCWIGSAKSNIGHCESAAGIAGLTKVLLQIKHRKLVPSLHSRSLNPNIDFANTPFVVNQALREWSTANNQTGQQNDLIAGISSFGAGGSNAHLIIRSWSADKYSTQRPPSASGNPTPQIFVLSAQHLDVLKIYAEKLLEFAGNVQRHSSDSFRQLAYTLQTGREAMDERLAVIADNWVELQNKLAEFLQYPQSQENIFYGQIKQNRETLVLFAQDEDLKEAVNRWIAGKKYSKLLELWVKGLDLDWNKFYADDCPEKISAPVYPFARERYWIEGCDTRQYSPLLSGKLKEESTAATPVTIKYFKKNWDRAQIQNHSAAETGEFTLVIADTQTQEIAKSMLTAGLTGDVFNVDTDSTEEFKKTDKYTACIDICGCGDTANLKLDWIMLIQNLLQKRSDKPFRLLCVTHGLESFNNPDVRLAGAERVGLYRMLQAEYTNVISRHVDLDCTQAISVELIFDELFSSSEHIEVCYRNDQRYYSYLDIWPDFSTRDENHFTLGNDPGVIWITGGTQGLGYLCALHLVKHYGVRKLVLSGREVLPPQAEWGGYLSDTSPLGKKIQGLQKLVDLGVQLRVMATSLTDFDAVKHDVNGIVSSLGKIEGLLHCAGRLDSTTPAFVRKPLSSIRTVTSPKIEGTINLCKALAEQPLRFVLLFSSVSAIANQLAAGQADYAMANTYLDYFAEANANQIPIISVQWPSWNETGMAAGSAPSKPYVSSGLLSLDNPTGLKMLDQVLHHWMGPVVLPALMHADVNDTTLLYRPGIKPKTIVVGETATSLRNTDLQSGVPKDLKTHVSTWIASIICQELNLPPAKLENDVRFEDYGVDSVLLAQAARKISENTAEPIDPSILFEYSTVDRITSWLMENHREELSRHFGHAVEKENSSSLSIPPNHIDIQKSPAAVVERKPDSGADIAVVGYSCRFPQAEDSSEFWQLLLSGRSAITRVPTQRFSGEHTYFGALLDSIHEFDPAFFLIPREDAKVMDPQSLVLLEESLRLFCHAGYSREEIKGSPIGVYIGARSQALDHDFIHARNPIMVAGQNYLATNISQFFDLQGPCLVVDTACSSALTGMNLGIKDLINGDIKAALVAGVNVMANDFAYKLFAQRKLLSTDENFHLFDTRANGIVLGEGVGAVLLKTLDQALADGDSIYAVIKGIAVNNDGRTAGPATPNIEAQKRVMKAALDKACLSADAVDHVEVNGSGSVVTDLLELKAIEAVYGKHGKRPLSLGSIKPNIGHPLCAEGIASLIKLIMMQHYQASVPFLSAQQPLNHFDFTKAGFTFERTSSTWKSAKTLALNCFADGGTNAHVIVGAGLSREAKHTQRQPMSLPPLNKIRIREDVNEKTRHIDLTISNRKRKNRWIRTEESSEV